MSALGVPLSRRKRLRIQGKSMSAADEALAVHVGRGSRDVATELLADEAMSSPECGDGRVRRASLSHPEIHCWSMEGVEDGTQVLSLPREVGDLVHGLVELHLHELDHTRQAVEDRGVLGVGASPAEEVLGDIRDPERAGHEVLVEMEALAGRASSEHLEHLWSAGAVVQSVGEVGQEVGHGAIHAAEQVVVQELPARVEQAKANEEVRGDPEATAERRLLHFLAVLELRPLEAPRAIAETAAEQRAQVEELPKEINQRQPVSSPSSRPKVEEGHGHAEVGMAELPKA